MYVLLYLLWNKPTCYLNTMPFVFIARQILPLIRLGSYGSHMDQTESSKIWLRNRTIKTWSYEKDTISKCNIALPDSRCIRWPNPNRLKRNENVRHRWFSSLLGLVLDAFSTLVIITVISGTVKALQAATVIAFIRVILRIPLNTNNLN